MARSSPKSKRIWPTLLVVAVASEALYLLMGRWSRDGESVRFLALFGSLFVLYVVAVVAARGGGSRTVVLVSFLAAAAFRVALLQAKGFPTPASESQAPPLLHAIRQLTGGGVAMRLTAAACDLTALALLPGLLKDAGMPSTMAIVYGWNPLVVKEGAGSGHLESVAILFAALALGAHRRNRALAAISYGVGLTSGPVLLTSLAIVTRALKAAVVVAIAVAAVGWGVLRASGVDLYALARLPIEKPFGGSLLPAATTVASVFLTRKAVYPAAVLFSLWALYVFYRAVRPGWKPSHLALEMLLATGTFLMVSPRVFPWSFTVLAFFAPFSRNPGWLVFTGTAPLAYLAIGEGKESFYLSFPQYFPAYATLIFAGLGGARSSKPR